MPTWAWILIIIGCLAVLGVVYNIVKLRLEKNINRILASEYNQIDNKESGEATALELSNICKIYGQGENEVHALKGVNLTFRKSEFVSILGPSGCGKTTMLNIIGGLDRYTAGDLIIKGVSTKNYIDSDWDTYRNNSIGFVFQNYNLIPHQTVLANVELALTLSGISKAERSERAKAVLQQVGLSGQENKKPNQLSGGQMQRVAIARALVNNPEIILADEPTGALDSETSIQVMELLKEVAKDRLVIMVTHNPQIAEKYSTRIINLLDGQVTHDSNPFTLRNIEREQPNKKGKSQLKMSTAFSLSLSNLRTKKGRTTLTSIAGSIGIIGIALVIAVSTGFSGYINKLQADTLSVYPVTVSEATVDLSDFNKLVQKTNLDKFPKVEEFYKKELFSKLTNMLKSNKITDEYLTHVNEFIQIENQKAVNSNEGWAYCVNQGYGYDVNNFIYSDIGMMGIDWTMPIDQLVRYIANLFDEGMQNSDLNISADFVREYIPTITRMPDNMALLSSQYDLLDGNWATEEDQLMLVVDSTNSIDDITLALLGFTAIEGVDTQTYNIKFSEKSTFTFSEVYEKEFYYLTNEQRYASVNDQIYDRTFVKGMLGTGQGTLVQPNLTLKVSGIVRLKKGIEQGVLDKGIAYTDKFYQKILNDNINSSVVNTAKQNADQKVPIYSWHPQDPVILGMISQAGDQAQAIKAYLDSLTLTTPNSVRELAGNGTVNKLSVYSAGYQQKEDLKAHLDKWNEKDGMAEEDKVFYSDSTAMLFSALNAIVDAVKIVLIAFTAISLVVSSIMIGIITYVSVVERTKEIGVLRSIGARKKDISRIFNAETFLIGLFAGLLGVGISYLLTIPINLIVGSLLENVGALAILNISDALVLVTISFILTLIAGIAPSRMAAKKDPVVALRSE